MKSFKILILVLNETSAYLFWSVKSRVLSCGVYCNKGESWRLLHDWLNKPVAALFQFWLNGFFLKLKWEYILKLKINDETKGEWGRDQDIFQD